MIKPEEKYDAVLAQLQKDAWSNVYWTMHTRTVNMPRELRINFGNQPALYKATMESKLESTQMWKALCGVWNGNTLDKWPKKLQKHADKATEKLDTSILQTVKKAATEGKQLAQDFFEGKVKTTLTEVAEVCKFAEAVKVSTKIFLTAPDESIREESKLALLGLHKQISESKVPLVKDFATSDHLFKNMVFHDILTGGFNFACILADPLMGATAIDPDNLEYKETKAYFDDERSFVVFEVLAKTADDYKVALEKTRKKVAADEKDGKLSKEDQEKIVKKKMTFDAYWMPTEGVPVWEGIKVATGMKNRKAYFDLIWQALTGGLEPGVTVQQ